MTGVTHLLTKTELSANAGADLCLSDAYDPSEYKNYLNAGVGYNRSASATDRMDEENSTSKFLSAI